MTGVPFTSVALNSSTVAPSEARRSTTASNRTAISSGSAPRRMSLPPAQTLMRSGRRAIAGSTWSSAIWSSSFPRTARLA